MIGNTLKWSVWLHIEHSYKNYHLLEHYIILHCECVAFLLSECDTIQRNNAAKGLANSVKRLTNFVIHQYFNTLPTYFIKSSRDFSRT